MPDPAAKKRSGALITVLAGINGAGKSSIGGEFLRNAGAEYFNPDEQARRLREEDPLLDQTQANSLAWQLGKKGLEDAIAAKRSFNFETTLGGNTITELLIEAAQEGAQIRMWYAGLESVELHLQRVKQREARGGHGIPAADIRRRWDASHANLVRMIPHLTQLAVFDNSAERDPATGAAPQPRLVLGFNETSLNFPTDKADTAATPEWAKPAVLAAFQRFGLIGPKSG